MPAEIPSSLSSLFGVAQFRDYPLVTISQRFTDERGQILNIADGVLGDVKGPLEQITFIRMIGILPT